MNSFGDRYARHWNLFQRGLLSSRELLLAFLSDAADSDSNPIELFRSLPEPVQSILVPELRQTPMEQIRLFIIGDADEDYLSKQSAVMRSKAVEILAYLPTAAT